MSFVHHEPDTRVVPCLGCNQLIDERDLVKSVHWWTSCCLFHPYHLWCVRKGPAPPHVPTHCADCSMPFDRAAARAAVRWGATFQRRNHRRTIATIPATGAVREDPGGAIERPPGISLVFVAHPPDPKLRPPLLGFPPGDADEQLVCSRFELVHDVCPDRDPMRWRTHLRAAPDDIELRAVYADWLEQSGDLRRARFVRVAIEERTSTGEAQAALGQRLRELRAGLPSTWCRDVFATASRPAP